MDDGTLSALAAVLSVIAVMLSALLTYRAAQRSRLDRAEDLATRFREPLLQAAHNLQSRLFNIVTQDFLGMFFKDEESTEQERHYAVYNTAYLVGQYLCWVEVIRRESQYIDPRSRENSRLIVEKLERVRDCFAESRRTDDRPLRLFRGEQRAVGEVMLVAVPTAAGDAPRWECLGYAAFIDAKEEPRFQQWFQALEEGIEHVAAWPEGFPPRLTDLQRALVDLMDVLDPRCERVPRPWRQRLPAAG